MRFAVNYLPRGQVGGDFYDLLPINEHCVVFIVGDVIGGGARRAS